MSRCLLALIACLSLFTAGCGGADADGDTAAEVPVILAPASMEDVLEAVADRWREEGGAPLKLSFAGTATNARQIEEGAPADLFLSADLEWMDKLRSENLIDSTSVRDIAAGQLVLVIPTEDERAVAERTRFTADDLTDLLGENGRLAVADLGAVPAGRYAAQALDWMGAGETIMPRAVESDNVRGALRLVETGEAAAGIVYATDARLTDDVRVLYRFPPQSHEPIRYLGARLASSDNEIAGRFLDYIGGESAGAILRDYGFQAPQARP